MRLNLMQGLRARVKLTILVSILLFIGTIASAQGQQPPQPDDSFDSFLLVFAAIALSVMCGAAIIGAFAASLVLLLLSLLVATGILSVSVFAGLYKRSLGTGFKTFLILLFGGGCSLIGIGAMALVQYFFHLPLSTGTGLLIGACCGCLGGILLALISFHIIKKAIYYAGKKMAMPVA